MQLQDVVYAKPPKNVVNVYLTIRYIKRQVNVYHVMFLDVLTDVLHQTNVQTKLAALKMTL